MKKLLPVLTLFILIAHTLPAQQPLTQDQRMAWWRQARFGMFIHWGLYAVPAGEWKGEEIPGIGEWIMKHAQIPAEEYRALAAQFNPVKFNAQEWVALAKSAGMKYITITSKHHDGFAMFRSKASPYNIVDATPYGKDVIKALADECHRQGIKICFYYSQSRDWNEPNGLDNDWDFPPGRDFQQYLDEKVKPQLTELLTQYGPIGLIWFDTPMSISRQQAEELKALVRKLQPACIISGRLGGGVQTDYSSTGDNVVPGITVATDWEVPATLNNTWGYKKNDHHWKSPADLTRLLFDIASKGGNYLLNVGPTAEGLIPAPSVDILNQVGRWMQVNGQAIYGTQASPYSLEFSWGNITRKPGRLYLGIFNWPAQALYLEGLKNKVKKVYLLADPAQKPLPFKELYNKELHHHRLQLTLPAQAPDDVLSVVVVEIEGEAQVEQTLAQMADGKIHLPGVVSTVTKNGQPATVNFNGRGGGAGGWTQSGITLAWQFKVEKPGRYAVDLVTTEAGKHGSPTWQGGHLVKMSVNGTELQVTIAPDEKEVNQRSLYWKKIHTHGGTVAFHRPGTYQLALTAHTVVEDDPGFTFKEVNLVPVE